MIDLAKLKAFERPSVEKEIFLLGEMQNVSISTLKQTTGMKMASLNERDPEDRITALALFVSDALGIGIDDARKICDVDIDAANEIAVECGRLTREYDEKRKAERIAAEKNSGKAQENMPSA